MVSRKYSAHFKIEMVEKYLNGSQMSIAKFAANHGISDSTFNDWVIKYKREGKDFCNITKEIEKINYEKPYLLLSEKHIDEIEDEDQPMSINRIRLKFNNSIIEFDESLLERVLKIVKEW